MIWVLAGCTLLAPAPPTPFAGTAALHVELEGSGPTAATDGPILVTRLEKLGAAATSTAPAPDRIALEVSAIRDTEALQWALRRNHVQLVFPDGRELTGADIATAEASIDDFDGRPRVNGRFTDEGGTRFCEWTGQAVGQKIAIVRDGVELSAPIVRERICGGSVQVTLGDGGTLDEAHALAAALSTPALASDWTLAVVR
ncbi:MAG: hypothetical protein H6737_30460 [Alphaproteobacteria bacterium]|nr:hypothetical protein [Alphaproteobacteria bacterium]